MNKTTYGALKRLIEEVKNKRKFDCSFRNCPCNDEIGGNDIALVEEWIEEVDKGKERRRLLFELESEKYRRAILSGEYGKILKKHENLALQLKKGATYKQVRDYATFYKKYDNWSLRDFDVVVALLNT
jgi:hypothetical protein